MAVKFKTDSQIIAKLGLEPNGRVQKFFTQTCARYNDPYVPFRTGALAETVYNGGITANVHDNYYVYEQKYAKRVYYGSHFNFRKDKHPKATAYWDKVMWSIEKYNILKEVQDYVEGK